MESDSPLFPCRGCLWTSTMALQVFCKDFFIEVSLAFFNPTGFSVNSNEGVRPSALGRAPQLYVPAAPWPLWQWQPAPRWCDPGSPCSSPGKSPPAYRSPQPGQPCQQGENRGTLRHWKSSIIHQLLQTVQHFTHGAMFMAAPTPQPHPTLNSLLLVQLLLLFNPGLDIRHKSWGHKLEVQSDTEFNSYIHNTSFQEQRHLISRTEKPMIMTAMQNNTEQLTEAAATLVTQMYEL